MTVKVRGRSSSGPFSRKKEIESKRAIKSRRIYWSSFFYFPSFSFSLLLSVCPSTYLPVQLCLSRSSRLPFRWPFGPLHRPSIKVPGAHTGARISVRVCEKIPHPRVYITRRDPSLVRSHFKHLLYHDRSLARSVLLSRRERFLLAVPRARRKDVGTRLRWSLDTN